jgi:multicomponent Na+:H+ antiporter subunit G
MVENLGYIIAILFVLLGTGFSLIGIIGYLRLPDVYTRIHAAGKVGVFGVVFLLIAAMFTPGLGWARGLALIILLLLAAPVISHVVQSAAYRLRIPLQGAVQDALKSKWG